MSDPSAVPAEAAVPHRNLIGEPLFDAAQIGLLRDALGGDDLCDMLSQLPDVARMALRDIGAAFAANDLQEVRRLAHRFKGTAGSFGAARLAALARAMELETMSLAALTPLIDDLGRAIDDTLVALPKVGRAAPAGATI